MPPEEQLATTETRFHDVVNAEAPNNGVSFRLQAPVSRGQGHCDQIRYFNIYLGAGQVVVPSTSCPANIQ